MAELPTGTVSFLITDLEGSTRLWEEHPEAMHAALARHNEILREAIEPAGRCECAAGASCERVPRAIGEHVEGCCLPPRAAAVDG
jgi:class 3 adenylate cyclase